MKTTLEQLLEIRSRLAADFIFHLDESVAELDKSPLVFRGEDLSIRKVYVEPTVLTAREAMRFRNECERPGAGYGSDIRESAETESAVFEVTRDRVP